jgi:hypothetical protein
MNLRHDRRGAVPPITIIGIVLVAVFAIVALAAVSMTDHADLAPKEKNHSDAIGYLSCSAHVTYASGSGSGAGTYSLLLGVGDHEGQPDYEVQFFMMPDALVALGSDFAVTFEVAYPNGGVLMDTELTASTSGTFDHTFESDNFLVFESGTYLVTAYFFVDGQQIGDGVSQACYIDGINWSY